MKKLIAAATLTLAILGATSVGSGTDTALAENYDCAHGPDTYRVRNVANWDVLNIRSGPGVSNRIVGTIPPHGSGVHCLGPCSGNWCRISWRGVIGWGGYFAAGVAVWIAGHKLMRSAARRTPSR